MINKSDDLNAKGFFKFDKIGKIFNSNLWSH